MVEVRVVSHAINGTLWVKLLPVALVVWVGLSEKAAGIIVVTLVVARLFGLVRNGIREQYWEPAHQQYRRHWADLVDDHSVWINSEVWREAGIKRLVSPWDDPTPAVVAPHELPTRRKK